MGHSNGSKFFPHKINKPFNSKPKRLLEGWMSPVAVIATAARFFLTKQKKIQSQTQKSFGGLVELCSSHSNGSKFFPHKINKPFNSKPKRLLEGWMIPVAVIGTAASFVSQNIKNLSIPNPKDFWRFGGA